MVVSMTINIGTITENVNKVNKSPVWYTGESETAYSFTIKPTSIINQVNPVVIIDYNSALLNCNYVSCETLGRKYFARISVDTAQTMRLECSVDVLSSWDLSNCPVTVVRNGGIGEPTKIPDNKLPVKPSTENIYQVPVSNDEFKQLLSTPYVLQVIGG